jgi:hypothetical protein
MVSRQLGSWLRAQRQARSWDVPEMARQLARASGDTRATLPDRESLAAYIRRWERNANGITERYRLLYCVALSIKPDQFGLWDEADQPAPLGEWPHVGDGANPDYAETVRRNEFLLLAGAALAGLAAPPLVHGWPDRHDVSRPELSDLLVAQLRAQTEGFRWLDRQRGAHDLLSATASHARNLTNSWRLTEETHPLRRDLAQIAADACHLVAYQAYDQGKRVQAIEWYRCSAELAAQARAQDLYVFAVCGVAFMHARNRDGELAMAALHQLSSLALSVTAQSYVAVYQAHAHASLHDRKAALLALDNAAVLSTKCPDEAPSPWLGIPDTGFVQRQRAMITAELGMAQALSVLGWLDEHTPEVFRRYRVTLLTDLALAHASQGHVEQAAALLACAAQRNAAIRSAEKNGRILRVRTALDQHADSASVTALDEVLRSGGLLPSGRRAGKR